MSDVFIKKGDTAKSETFNTVSVLADILQVEMRVDFPDDYKQGKFPTNSNEYQVGVSKTIITRQDATNNNTVLSGVSGDKVIFRVYPNFRLKWLKKIVSDSIGSVVSCRVLDANTQSVLINNVDNGSNLTGYNVGLKELDIEFTFLTSGDFTGFSLYFDSAPSKSDIKWTVGLDNIQGLVSELAKKATKVELEAQLNKIYYIGKIEHIAVDKTPSELNLPGTWEQMKGRFLLGSDGSIYPYGEKSGSSTHILNNDEMPSHTHPQNPHNHAQNAHNHNQNPHQHRVKAYMPDYPNEYYNVNVSKAGRSLPGSGDYYYALGAAGTDPIVAADVTATNQSTTATNQSATATNQNAGGGQAHNNMPPYEVVHIWKRIS